MKLDGIIKHGALVDVDDIDYVKFEVIKYGGSTIRLCETDRAHVCVTFGPIGSYVDITKFYTREETDALLNLKLGKLTAGRDMKISPVDVIDNEHVFFENGDIDDIWNMAVRVS